MIARARLAASAALLAGALAGCEGPPGPAAPDGGAPPVSGDLALVRMVRWPGGGAELTIRIDPRAGGGPRRDLSAAIRVEGDDPGAEVSFQARPTGLAPGYTALLVRPPPAGQEAERERLAAALAALLSVRPPAEQIALFRWADEVEQVVGFTGDRARLGRGLPLALAPPEGGVTLLEPEAATLAVAADLQAVGTSGPRVMRAVLLAGADVPAAARADTAMPLLALDPRAPPDPAAADAAAAIDRLASEAHYTIGVCGGEPGAPARVRVDGVTGVLPIAWPEPWHEVVDAPCDPVAIGAEPQPVPARIDLVFSDEERAIYQQRVDSSSKADFRLGVVLGAGQPVIPASAHLRGKGTLGCQRKSYTVTLDGPERHLFPDFYDDEMYLVAMCGDEGYLQLHTSKLLMADLGLFPPRHRYVELTLDGATRGVYLMVEKADDALARSTSRVRAVLRRRFSPPADTIEVEKADGDPAAAAAAWEAFHEDLAGLTGEELEATAAARLDLDGFFTWVALMTALQNGDYVDELYLTASEARGPGGGDGRGGEGLAWIPTGWDADDLFTPCHYAGNHAIADPHGLLYCAEGRLEKILLADPLLYARYVDTLEALLAALTPERLQRALDTTGAALLPWFERAEICQASVELLEDHPPASDPAEAQRFLRGRLALLRDRYTARRALLLDRIAAARLAAGRGGPR